MRVGVGQASTAARRHQVVGWRAHPGEMLGVPLPVGQRPEGPDLESRRRRGRAGFRRRDHDDDRRSVRLRIRRGRARRETPAAAAASRSARGTKGEARAGGDCPPRAASTSGTGVACSCSPRATRLPRPRSSPGRPTPSPASRSILEALARAQYDAGRYEEAMTTFTTLTADQPDRRLRPLRPRPGGQQGGGAAPGRGAPGAGRRHAPRPGPLRPGAARSAGPAGGRVRVTGPEAAQPEATPPAPLSTGSPAAPSSVYDVALLDLDGVVYVGPDAVPGVPEALAAARTAGMRLGFVTNNAARTPEEVAAHLDRTRRPRAGRRRHHQLAGRGDGGRGPVRAGRTLCSRSAAPGSPPRSAPRA